jgi:hypothetical protein
MLPRAWFLPRPFRWGGSGRDGGGEAGSFNQLAGSARCWSGKMEDYLALPTRQQAGRQACG